MSLDASERSIIIDRAMEAKFGTLQDWKHPELLHSFGPNDLGFVEAFEKRLGETRESVKAALEEMSDDTLCAIRDELNDALQIRESDWRAIAAAQINQLHKAKPAEDFIRVWSPRFRRGF